MTIDKCSFMWYNSIIEISKELIQTTKEVDLMMIYRKAYTIRYKSYTIRISKTPNRYSASCTHDYMGQEHLYTDTLKELMEQLKMLPWLD